MNIDTALKEWINGTGRWANMRQNRDLNQEEFEFSLQYYTPSSRKQWSSNFGEKLVESVVNGLDGCKVITIQPIVMGYKKHRLDLETENCYIEVKTRNYTTSGTAGDKIFGTTVNYRDVHSVTGKPVLVVLVGYQEMEAVKKMQLFATDLQPMMDFVWEQYRIKYIKLSDLMKGKYNHLL